MKLPRGVNFLPLKAVDAKTEHLMRVHLGKLRAYVEWLGKAIAKQPKSKAATTELAVKMANDAPDHAQIGYEVILLKRAVTVGVGNPIAPAVAPRPDAAAIAKEIIVRNEALNTKKTIKGVFPPQYQRMVDLASQRVPIYLVGPAGCGKTYLAGKLAETLSLAYADQSMSVGVSESQLNGWLIPGKGGEFCYVSSAFVKIYEHGGVFLFDEIDNSDANLLVFMNKAIGNSEFFIPQRHQNPCVKKHKDFVAIAAANTYGTGADAMYVGRAQLDAATLDRFRSGMIEMTYDHDVERSLADYDVCDWAWRIRKNIEAHKLERIMSTRTIQHFQKMKAAAKWGRSQWEESYFVGWTPEERRMVQPA